jgi:integrase
LELKRIPELLQRIDSYTGRPLTRLPLSSPLVFIRSSELRFARWSEIDFETSMWTIPQSEKLLKGEAFQRGSKMRTPHLVPLSRQALAILNRYKLSGDHDLFSLAITTIVNR